MIEHFIEVIRNTTGGSPTFSEIIPGKLIRFATSDKRGDENGWCKLFLDGDGGVYGCWRQGISETWQARQPQTPGDRAAFAEKVKHTREETARIEAELRAECRKKSAELWEGGRDVDAKHSYLVAKRIRPHGIKQLEESLLVPVRDTAGTLHGIQFIQADGSKRFKSGTAVAGCYHAIGVPNGKLLIAEGYATGATLHEITGRAVAVAFNAGNLGPVVKALRAKLPDVVLVICADDDHGTEGNPGLTKATEAARVVDGLLAKPFFPGARGPKDTDFNDLARLAGPEAVKACIDLAAPVTEPMQAPAPDNYQDTDSEPEPVPPIPQLFASAHDLLNKQVKIFPLIGKLIQRGMTGQLFGPSGSGKTFVIMCMALSIATGRCWNIHQCEQGLVLYFTGEGFTGIALRLAAWLKHHGHPVPDLFHVSKSMISFEPPSIRAAIAEGRALETALGKPVAFIVVDTLARHLDGDENSSKDVGAFITAVDSLRGAFPGSTAVIVHHTGHESEKAGRARGSSALRAAMDFEIQCDKGLLTFTKMKDGALPEPVEFKLTPVDIGSDDDGETITSCIVQYGERSVKNREAALTSNERQLLSLVNNYPDLLVGDLRKVFFDKRREADPETKHDTLKKAFIRSLDGLISKNMVHMSGNLVRGGQGTFGGQMGTNVPAGEGDKGTHPYKGVPMSLPVSQPEILTLDDSDFEGVFP